MGGVQAVTVEWVEVEDPGCIVLVTAAMWAEPAPLFFLGLANMVLTPFETGAPLYSFHSEENIPSLVSFWCLPK